MANYKSDILAYTLLINPAWSDGDVLMRCKKSFPASGLILAITVISAVAICSCAANSSDPVSNTTPENITGCGEIEFSSRRLIGYGLGFIPESHDSIEFTPLRNVDLHLNIRQWLEDFPCTTCFKVKNIVVDLPQHQINCDIELTHPFPGMNNLSLFDVRLIIISDGSLHFPGMSRTVPYAPLGDFTILNPTGFTHMWNTVDFGPGSGPAAFLEYSKGKIASPGGFTGTVNPFIAYGIGQRSYFQSGAAIAKSFQFYLPEGQLRFGYAIDASWEPPLHEPVTDIEDDFPPNANALEPMFTGFNMDKTLFNVSGNEAEVTVSITDRQAYNHFAYAGIEAPALWFDQKIADSIDITGIGPYHYPNDVHFTITNEYGTDVGSYPALIVVDDGSSDPVLGKVIRMFHLVHIPVSGGNPDGPDLLVHIKQSWVYPDELDAGNMFVTNMVTYENKKYTDFAGVGGAYGIPRIDPTGRWLLLPFGGVPASLQLHIFDVETGEYEMLTPDIYTCDGAADFHPLEQKILFASSDGWALHDLYTCKYDGSERTLIKSFGDYQIRNPRWRPDGQKILLSIGEIYSEPYNTSLVLYDISSGTSNELVPTDGLDEYGNWSPVKINGDYLVAFSSNRANPSSPDNDTDIYILNPETKQILKHIDTGFGEEYVSWSPDGSKLIFAMGDGQWMELYIYDLENDECTQLTNDDTSDRFPTWCWGW